MKQKRQNITKNLEQQLIIARFALLNIKDNCGIANSRVERNFIKIMQELASDALIQISKLEDYKSE